MTLKTTFMLKAVKKIIITVKKNCTFRVGVN